MGIERVSASPLSGAESGPESVADMFDPLNANDDDGPAEEELREPQARPEAETLLASLIAQIDDINLARYVDNTDLDQIGAQVIREYEIDKNSRAEWEEEAEKALRFAKQKTTPKTYPWPGASSMIFPLITQATIEFGARTMPAIIQGKNVVKGVVWGSDKGTPVERNGQPMTQPGPNGQPQPVWLIPPGGKRELADKIGEHMSWQLLSDMKEWKSQTDAMIHQMPIVGGAARKTFFDVMEDKSRSLFVSILNLVWNRYAPSFDTAPRHSEKVLLYPFEIIQRERAGIDESSENGEGMFLPLVYAAAGTDSSEKFDGRELGSDGWDEDAPHLFIEQHRRLDLDGDGYPEPYIITVHHRSCKVVRIVANYCEKGIKASKDGDTIFAIEKDAQYTLYPFLPPFDGGSYPNGFGHLLLPLNDAINTTLNQSFDAGHLQNAGGGFVSNELGLPSGQTLFQVGKFTRVTTKGAAIRDSVFPLPFNGPSPVLFQILGFIVTAAKEIGAVGNILSGDAAIANAPPTTVLALIEQGMKVYTSIYERVFTSLEAELNKLHNLNKRHIKDTVKYDIGDESREISAADYARSGAVQPVADPKMTTDMQKLVRSQILQTTSQNNPLINQKEVLTRVYEAANIERIEDLFVPEDPNAQAFAMAMQQATLGKLRAEELEKQTHAFLNMSLARKNSSAAEEAAIEQQLTFMRQKIEALNTQAKFAAIDSKQAMQAREHAHQLGMALGDRHHEMVSDAVQHARDLAMQGAQDAQATAQQPLPVQPTPAPAGALPMAPDAPAGPDVTTPSSPGTGNTDVPGDLAGAM